MNPITRIGYLPAIGLLAASILVGCNQKAPTDATAAPPTNQSAANPSTEAAIKAAADFVDALVKGDGQRANALLTPKAIQQTTESGKEFSPPGWQNTTYRIGEVRTPTVNEAVVRCVLTTNATGKPQNEEMYCCLRLVDNLWRVSGIAYTDEKNPAGALWNFESGQITPIPQQRSMPGPVATTPSNAPRVAQEPTGPPSR